MIVFSLVVTGFSCFAKAPVALWEEIERDCVIMQKQVAQMVDSIKQKFGETTMAISSVLENPDVVNRTSQSWVTIKKELVSRDGSLQTYQLTFDLPNVDRKDIKVQLEKYPKTSAMLILTVTNKSSYEEKTNNQTLKSFSETRNSIKIQLPDNIDVSTEPTMTFKDGTLEVQFPTIGKQSPITKTLSMTDN